MTTENQLRSRNMAAAASRPALVTMGPVEDVDGLTRIHGLSDPAWGSSGQDAVPVNTVTALLHTGNYVAEAWRSGDLIVAPAGFAHGPGGPALQHRIAGVVSADVVYRRCG